MRRTTGELLKLEHGIKSGDIDPYVLREFRDAVDYIRKPRGPFRNGRRDRFRGGIRQR